MSTATLIASTSAKKILQWSGSLKLSLTQSELLPTSTFSTSFDPCVKLLLQQLLSIHSRHEWLLRRSYPSFQYAVEREENFGVSLCVFPLYSQFPWAVERPVTCLLKTYKPTFSNNSILRIFYIRKFILTVKNK